MRLFIAVELGAEQKSELTHFQHKIKHYVQGARWVSTQNMHLTLKFLGETEEDKGEELRAAMHRACHRQSPFTVVYGGCGVFPNPKKARVLWVGLNRGFDEVSVLAHNLERELAACGFAPDRKAYHPHLTVGRLRGSAEVDSINRFLEEGKTFCTGSQEICALVLFESRLTPKGALYRSVEKVAFGGESGKLSP